MSQLLVFLFLIISESMLAVRFNHQQDTVEYDQYYLVKCDSGKLELDRAVNFFSCDMGSSLIYVDLLTQDTLPSLDFIFETHRLTISESLDIFYKTVDYKHVFFNQLTISINGKHFQIVVEVIEEDRDEPRMVIFGGQF